jgi:hypothetical protein
MKLALLNVKSKATGWIAAAALLAIAALATGLPAGAANVMNYGADGNDYFQFTNPSMACDKASGFTTLITFAMHVDADGTLEIAGVACSNGIYRGPANWGSLVATLKTAPTTVTRYEVAIGGWQDTSYNNIKSLVAAQGVGSGSILYKNFQALKKAVPGIDAIDDDDELTYDQKSSAAFANMLGGLGYKFTMVPYTAQSFWVNLYHSLTNCDYIYLQCYEGGAGNDPGNWNSAFGGGVKVIPGQESNTANPATFAGWYHETGVQGGFYYPDVVFNTTYWSAAIVEANGSAPAAPAGVTAVAGGRQVSLSWNTVPGAISYNVKRSTLSGGETKVANVSTLNYPWPSSNQYLDAGLTANITYYYKITAVNTNGESAGSAEVSGMPTDASVFNFELPGIGAGNFQYDPLGGPWTFNGASPNGSGLVANGSGFGNPNAPGANTQAAFLQEDGSASQTLRGFVPGVNYTITFSAAERNGYNQSWNVQIDNRIIGSFNPGSAATAYTDYSASFIATASAHTLKFSGTDLAGGDNTVFIDNVRVSPALQPPPTLTTNTWPATAVDVVGGQVALTAGFASSSPIAYQWKMIKSGVTNVIPGATNTSLTLTNLQLVSSASYQLQASNAYGTTLSTPAPLTVNSVPAPVNNIVTAYAAQTGLGAALTNFTPTWTVPAGSLIAGQSPSSVGGGNFSDPNGDHAGVIGVLTDGSVGWINYWPGIGASPAEVACGSGAGQSVTYTLTGSTYGYDLTNITVYGGWGDAGRDQQAYTIYYSTVSAPATFIILSSVNYTPSDSAGVQSATRARLTPASGYLATNVAVMKFDFTTPPPENGYCGYSEIDVFGSADIPPPSPVGMTAAPAASGVLVMNLSGLVIGRSYTVECATNLTSPVWLPVTNFVAAALSASVTNSVGGSDEMYYQVVGY